MNLALPTVEGAASSPLAARVSGKTYGFALNDQGVDTLTVAFDQQVAHLTLRDGNGTHRVSAGYGAWQRGSTTLERSQANPMAASGAWTNEDTYVFKLYFTETPFCATLTCRFAGERLYFDYKMNVGFGPTERPQLVGELA